MQMENDWKINSINYVGTNIGRIIILQTKNYTYNCYEYNVKFI